MSPATRPQPLVRQPQATREPWPTLAVPRCPSRADPLTLQVGAHPILGAWAIEDSVPMDWVEGCRWEVTVELPEFELVEYKYAVRCGWAPDGPAIWQGGPNFMVATNTVRRPLSARLSLCVVKGGQRWLGG